MAAPIPRAAQPSELRALQEEIESFIRAQPHSVVAEDETIQFGLTAAEWLVTVEFDKLLFEVWNADRSIARRVEEIAYRDRGRLGLFVRRSAGKASSTLEIRDMGMSSRPTTGEARSSYQSQLAAMLGKQIPGWKFERVSHRTDREHTFSGLYTRGVARNQRLGLSGTFARRSAGRGRRIARPRRDLARLAEEPRWENRRQRS
jgi:hypothetical protein